MIIRLRFTQTESVPSGLFSAFAEEINQICFEGERAALEDARNHFSEIPDYIFDSCLYRIETFRDYATQVRAVKEGSVEVAIVASALAHWLLTRTIGTSAAEAWKKTETHERLVEFFLQKENELFEKIVRWTRHPDSRRSNTKTIKNNVTDIEAETAGKTIKIEAQIDPRVREDRPKPYEDIY